MSSRRKWLVAFAALAALLGACDAGADLDDPSGPVDGFEAASVLCAPTISSWAVGVSYAQDALVQYGGQVYRCRVAHTAVAGWTPPSVPSLWEPITCTAVPPPVPVLDQSFTGNTFSGVSINDGPRFVAQTYTAGRSGTLDGVAIDVQGSGSFALHVMLRGVVGGVPTGKILAESLRPTNGSTLSTVINFATAAPQVAGQKYAIIVDYPSAPVGQRQGTWSGATGNGYAAGQALTSSDGVSWSAARSIDQDLRFQTYLQ